MNTINKRFLEALKASLQKENIAWTDMSKNDGGNYFAWRIRSAFYRWFIRPFIIALQQENNPI